MRNVTLFAHTCCAAAILILTGCGGNGLTSPSASISPSASMATGGTALASLSHYNDPTAVGTGGNPAITCPTDAPRIYHAGVLEKRLELQWQPVFNVHQYQVEVQFLSGGNLWTPFAVNNYQGVVLAEIYGESAGRYRLRVRNADPTCVTPGSWSDWVILSIDSNDPPPAVTPEEQEPGSPGGGGNPPPPGTTISYWIRTSGSDQAAESGCENPGGGQTGNYLGGGVCQINTPPGEDVAPPQSGQWSPTGPPV